MVSFSSRNRNLSTCSSSRTPPSAPSSSRRAFRSRPSKRAGRMGGGRWRGHERPRRARVCRGRSGGRNDRAATQACRAVRQRDPGGVVGGATALAGVRHRVETPLSRDHRHEVGARRVRAPAVHEEGRPCPPDLLEAPREARLREALGPEGRERGRGTVDPQVPLRLVASADERGRGLAGRRRGGSREKRQKHDETQASLAHARSLARPSPGLDGRGSGRLVVGPGPLAGGRPVGSPRDRAMASACAPVDETLGGPVTWGRSPEGGPGEG